ncbi:hypothetical protein MHU86_1407 [Fragilaria crotonensis]|nr:hypothetical protein MHU86_1407 [Fragilaria crotonensis]
MASSNTAGPHTDDEEDSWEEYDDEPIVLHRGGKPRADRRKVIDNTTPTLEDEDRHNHQHQTRHGQGQNDQPQRHRQQQQHQYQVSHQGLEEDDEEEDDVEEEMISLEQERIRRARSHLTIISAEPSASNASSACIATSATAAKHHNRDDDDQSLRRTLEQSRCTYPRGRNCSALDWLSTPLAGGHRKDRHSPASRPLAIPITSIQVPISHTRTGGKIYPTRLQAMPHQEPTYPEDEELRHQFFQEGEDAETSWTKRYIFESEGGTAEHTRIGKKNRRVSGRRSRGSNESPREYTPRQDQLQHFLMDQHQPHHLRRQDGTRSNDDEVPQPLNFEGAFAPPSDRGIFQRPVPSSAPNDPPFRRPIPSSSQNDPIAFSTGSKSFVPPHQTFNPHVLPSPTSPSWPSRGLFFVLVF